MSAPATAYLCHTPADAADAVRHEARAGAALYTTLPAVVDELAARGLAATDLSDLLSDVDVLTCWQTASALVDQVLTELDARHAADYCARYGLPPVRVFRALFGYEGKLDGLAVLLYHRALMVLLHQGCRVLHVYGDCNSTFFPPGSNYRPVTDHLQRRGALQVVYHEPPAGPSEARRCLPSGPTRSGRARVWLRAAKRWLRERQAHHRLRGAAMLFPEPLCDLRWTPPLLPGAVAVDPALLAPARGPDRDQPPAVPAVDLSRPLPDFLPPLLAGRFLTYLHHHAAALLGPLVAIHARQSRRPFALVACGVAPAVGANALIAAYARSVGVPVAVMQHGGSYGTQLTHGIHAEADYGRADHFLSYGFTVADLPATEWSAPPPAVHPVGSIRVQRAGAGQTGGARASTYDVVYPLNDAIGLWEAPLRRRSGPLHQAQRVLLDRLAALPARVLIKRPPDSPFCWPGHPQFLATRPQLTLTNSVSFSQALADYRPRAVVFDLPSTPLCEVVADDAVQIFLLEDPLLPFTPTARALLERRAFLTSDPHQLCDALASFLAGKLPPRCDPAFRRHFVLPEGEAQQRAVDVLRRRATVPPPAPPGVRAAAVV